MKIGFVGSGNMARSLALGLKAPALFSDSGSGRAGELALLVGGESATSAEIARDCDIVLLCHKPKQLRDVATEFDGFSGTIVSVLAATPLDALREAYPAARVVRTMPNIPVEFGSGVIAVAAESDDSPEVLELLGRGGLVIEVPEEHFETVTAVGGCAPAFFALFAQALVRSAVDRGLDEETAKRVVGQTLSGSGDALEANGMDTAGLMTAVASPGGLTERALNSFEGSGLQDAVDRAVATVLGA
jgi:pyrroline-5-carboxylate reductase